MVYDYVVTLENRSRRYVNNISALLLFFSLAFFIWQLFKVGFSQTDPTKALGWGWDFWRFVWMNNKILLMGTVLVFALFSITSYQVFVKERNVLFSRTLLIAGIVWLSIPSLLWMSFPLIGLGLLEKLAKSDLEIGFASREIVFNSLFKRRFSWTAFNNIMLKDDMLTMDFKNNRILQRMTIDEEADADEDEFNAYCRQHLSEKI